MTNEDLKTFGNDLPHIESPIANFGDKSEIIVGGTNTTDTKTSVKYGHPYRMGRPLDTEGVPVSREDVNGIYNLLSKITHYLMAGGKIPWSSAESEAIGGYPKNAEVLYNGIMYRSLVDSNTATPIDSTKWAVADHLPLIGGTMRGEIKSTADVVLSHSDTDGKISILAGKTEEDLLPPSIELYDTEHPSSGGDAKITAAKKNNSTSLVVSSDGKAYIKKYVSGAEVSRNNIVRSVAGKPADENGAVVLSASDFGAYLKTGGLLSGAIVRDGQSLAKRNVNTDKLSINGGTSSENGASITLFGSNSEESTSGGLEVSVVDSYGSVKKLTLKPDGSIVWNEKNVVLSVNGTGADYNGNVEVGGSKPDYANMENVDAKMERFVGSGFAYSYTAENNGWIISSASSIGVLRDEVATVISAVPTGTCSVAVYGNFYAGAANVSVTRMIPISRHDTFLFTSLGTLFVPTK